MICRAARSTGPTAVGGAVVVGGVVVSEVVAPARVEVTAARTGNDRVDVVELDGGTETLAARGSGLLSGAEETTATRTRAKMPTVTLARRGHGFRPLEDLLAANPVAISIEM